MTATRSPKTAVPDVLSFLPRQDRHKPKGPPVRRSKSSRWRAIVLISVHVVIGVHIWHWLATGESMTPVEPSESMQTFELGRINAGFLLFAGLIATTLIFGRWFCGWACHVVALQDLSGWILRKLALKPRPVRSRLLVLAPWLVAGHMFAWPWLQHWWDPVVKPMPEVDQWQWHLTTTDLWATFPGPIMAIGSFLVVGFLIVWWLGAKGFCTYGCPYGAFFTIADRFAPVRIKVTDACEGCGHCTSVCTSNVRVHEEVARYGHIVDPGCMKCLDCVSVCPKDALYVGAARPRPFTTSQQRIQVRADFTWGEELLLAVVAFVAVQFSFRGAWFGEQVPFLMAVGIGVITAVFTLLLVRLLLRRDVTFQHTALKSGGRLAVAGRWSLLASALWLAFTVHTTVANQLQRAADQSIQAADGALNASFYGTRPVAPAELEPAVRSIDAARSWLWLERPDWLEWRALALRGIGRHAEAEQALLAARGDRATLRLVEANLALAAYFMDVRRRRFDEAQQLIAHSLAIVPDHPIGLILQRRLQAMPK